MLNFQWDFWQQLKLSLHVSMYWWERTIQKKKVWSVHRKQLLSDRAAALIDRRWKKKPKSKLEFLFCSSLWSDPQKQLVWATTCPVCFLPFRYGRSIWGQMHYCSSLLPIPKCHECPTAPLLLQGWMRAHDGMPEYSVLCWYMARVTGACMYLSHGAWISHVY